MEVTALAKLMPEMADKTVHPVVETSSASAHGSIMHVS